MKVGLQAIAAQQDALVADHARHRHRRRLRHRHGRGRHRARPARSQAHINAARHQLHHDLPRRRRPRPGAHFHGASRPSPRTTRRRSAPSARRSPTSRPGVRTGGQVVAGELNWGTQIHGVGRRLAVHPRLERRRGRVLHRRRGASARRQGLRARQHRRRQPVPRRRARSASWSGSRTCRSGSSACSRRRAAARWASDQDDMVIAPYTTAMKRLMGTDRLGMIYVAAVVAGPGATQRPGGDRRRCCASATASRPGQDADFMMRSQEEIASARPRRHRRRCRCCSARSPRSRCWSAASAS